MRGNRAIGGHEHNLAKYLVKSPTIEQRNQVVEIAFCGVQSALDGQDVLLQFRKDMKREPRNSGSQSFPNHILTYQIPARLKEAQESGLPIPLPGLPTNLSCWKRWDSFSFQSIQLRVYVGQCPLAHGEPLQGCRGGGGQWEKHIALWIRKLQTNNKGNLQGPNTHYHTSIFGGLLFNPISTESQCSDGVRCFSGLWPFALAAPKCTAVAHFL